MREWLTQLGLGQYAEVFAANDIDLDVARLLDDADLERLGLSLGHRRRFLNAAAALPPATSAPAPASTTPRPERRQLTVMFCDLADSTGLAARLDPEDLQAVIGEFRRAASGTIERFQGYVAKYMGDGILAYFCYPQARADAADRAVNAGIGIARALPAVPGVGALAVRVGIATGEVVVGEQIGIESSREWSVVGDAPNLAARLQTAAQPGQVLVADATRRLCRSAIAWSGPRLATLKGFAAPVPVWEAREDTAAPPGRSSAAPPAPRLVGRRGEVALLAERLELAAAGQAQVVLLMGEAGIGKSALARAAVERARGEGFECTLYYCSPFHQSSELNPFVTQVERDAGIVRAAPPAENLARLQAWLGREAAAGDVDAALFAALLSLPMPLHAALRDLTPQALRAKTLRALEAQILRRARGGPGLLVLEDIHWMDPSTGDLVGHLVDRLSDQRILLLATARPEFDARWTRRPHVTLLTLNRLGQRDATSLAAEIPGARALPPEHLARLLQRAGGNPLFIEELTRAVAEALAGDGATSGAGERLDALIRVVPTSLRDLLAERLDRLGPAKETAQAAAVIGQEFDSRLLEAIVDAPARCGDDLARLRDAEIVVAQGPELPTGFAFRHALIQEAAYQSLLKSRRREHHRRIAESLERGIVPEAGEREPERIAQHYAEAGVVDRAIACWQQSGIRAARRSANIEAIEQLSAALALVRQQPNDAERAGREFSLLITLGPTLQATSGWHALKVREVYDDALRLARETGRAAELFPALWGRWLIAHAGGEAEDARVLLAQLSVLAQELRDPDLLLQMHHAAGSTHCTDGRFTLALDEVDACIAGYDLARHRHQAMQYGGHDPCVCTTCIGALARFIKGQRRAAERWSDDALDLAGRVDHAPSVAHAQVYRAELGQIRGEVDSTLQLADSVLAIGIEKGLSQYAAWAKMMRGWALARQGRADAGLAEIEEGLQALRRTGVRYHTPHRLGMRAQAYIAAGRHAQARDAIDEAIASVAATGERWYEAELVRLDAAVLAGTAAPDERAVEARLEQAIALAAEQGAKLWECRARLDLADRLARRSRPDAARDVLRPVLAWGEDVDLVERAAAAAFVARLS